MLLKIKYTAFALLFFMSLNAQVNLVPNPSFENTIQCIDSSNSVNYVDSWSNPTTGTPDILAVDFCNNYLWSDRIRLPNNNSLGYQNPRTGNKCAGIAVYDTINDGAREYLQVQLLTPLKPQAVYCVEFYAVLANKYSRYAVKDLGVHFLNDSIFSDTSSNPPFEYPIISFTNNVTASSYITDTLSWTKVSGTYLANGGEKYMLVGNFSPKFQADYIFNYSQFSSSITYYFIDDVSVIECDSLVGVNEIPFNTISIYPNPAKDFVSIELSKNYNQTQLRIYNLTGQLISQKQITQPNQTIPISELGNGVYIFVIQSGDNLIGRQRVLVAK
ncbi:MAG: T9SS type A sorting domain-containing protein [Sphingobacteriales bacterium JAD_PAG50586_3]|nr:MAG: T9SS type A sorting domain-containing protein [Sphingobacteriales bacterium JAD_PAG50586_3]